MDFFKHNVILSACLSLFPPLRRKAREGLLPLFFLLPFLSCSDTPETTYSNMPARFVVASIQSCPPLYTAVNNMGEWCTVQAGNNVYIVKGAKGDPMNMPLTAMTGYQGFYLGIAGLIIGLPYVPEMNRDLPRVTCYDLACPACYKDSNISRTLSVDFSKGTAGCGRCGRTYDLNDRGIVTAGEGGVILYRYRVECNGTSLTVSN